MEANDAAGRCAGDMKDIVSGLYYNGCSEHREGIRSEGKKEPFDDK